MKFANLEDENMLDVSGFDARVPKVIRMFVSGEYWIEPASYWETSLLPYCFYFGQSIMNLQKWCMDSIWWYQVLKYSERNLIETWLELGELVNEIW